ncbi:hypothetical protein I4U23_004840 [Adineta vaga]|nr:hypothetical protein I4U23_004840 [Adineta vaga]
MATNLCGLILLGNSGVGKIFLANRLLNDDQAFESKFSARSVTRRTEWKDMSSKNGDRIYAIANIPGLIEANQQLVDENREEIMKAFEQHSLSIVIFVFGHRNGRIPDEDVVAFLHINDAYAFEHQSLFIIVNGIPSERPEQYEANTAHLLSELIKVDVDRICFFEHNTSDEYKMFMHDRLYEIVEQCEPALHTKKHDIQLITDEIAQLKSQSKHHQDALLAQLQEVENSRRQIINLPPRRSSPIEQESLPMETNETTPYYSSKIIKFNEHWKQQQMKFKQTTERVEKSLNAPSKSVQLELAESMKKGSERNTEQFAQLSLPPDQIVVFVEEKKREIVVRNVQRRW